MNENETRIDVIEFMGKKLNFLGLGKYVAADIPVYPGRMETAF